jgi:RNA polymerase subunit RPABC4/transcription elongation factor Spt4
MKESNFEVSLAKETCPVCAKEFDGPIVMNNLLTSEMAKKVKEIHGRSIGFKEEPCDECKGHMEKGIVIIGIDPERSEDMRNPWRTGAFVVVKDEFFERQKEFIDNELIDSVIQKRVTFMDHNSMVEFGMIK